MSGDAKDGLSNGVYSVSERLRYQEYSFNEALHRAGFGKYQYISLTILSLAYFADIAEENLSLIIGPQLLCTWNLSAYQEALVTNSAFLGMFFGAFAWGKISDTYGRRVALGGVCLWTCFYGCLSALSPRFGWYLVLRFFTGVGIGGIHIVTTFAAEIVETKQRARSMMVMHACSGLAPVFTSLMAFIFINASSYGWRLFILAVSLPQLVSFFLIIFVLDESPRFLLVSGETNKAKWVLTKMSAMNRADLLFGDIKPIAHTERGHINQLFLDKNTTRLTISQFIIWFVLLSCYFGTSLLFTESLQAAKSSNTDFCYAGDTVSYCKAQCKALDSFDYAKILITHANLIIAAFISMLLADYLGRIYLISICVFVYCISSLPLLFCTNIYIAIFIVLICKICLSAAIQAFYLFLCEAYPTNVRSVAIGAGTTFGRVGMILTPFIAQVLAKSGIQFALSTYLILAVILLFTLYNLPYDTKNRQIKDA